MATISGYNTNDFVPADEIFSKVKRSLSSFSGIDIIDENEFPLYAMEILEKLGNGVLMEEDAIISIKNYEGVLPENFNRVHSLYRCDINSKVKTPQKHLQNTIGFENDITYEILCRTNSCDIDCVKEKTIEKIQVKQYFTDFSVDYSFNNLEPLRVSPSSKSKFTDDSINLRSHSPYEVSINKDSIITNFDNGNIYMNYYGTPVDDEGYPLIKNDVNVKNAIEWYIKYKVFLNLWENDAAPNMQTRWQNAQNEYEKWMAEARFIVKLPAFSTMINSIRNKRAINAVSVFSQIDNKRY